MGNIAINIPVAPPPRVCPPRDPLAHFLTLVFTTITVFLAARTMLGPIAGPGGTVFALFTLILLALIGMKELCYIT